MASNASYLLSVVWSMERNHWITLPMESLAVTAFVNVDLSSEIQKVGVSFFHHKYFMHKLYINVKI